MVKKKKVYFSMISSSVQHFYSKASLKYYKNKNTYSRREQDSPKDLVPITDMGNQTPQHLLAVALGVGASSCALRGTMIRLSALL